MMKRILLACTVLVAAEAGAQDTMSVWDCMRYAVEHSHGLRQRELQLDNSETAQMQAVGAFLPSLSASTGTQWNFGRAIDPETNTYTSVSTFNNGYGLNASLPLFDGLYRLHALRAARADLLMQKSALQAERDQVALATYQAYTDVVYAQEALRLAQEKVHESAELVRQTQIMAEEGLKSAVDVAQMQAQLAADELALTRQENQQETAMLKLKEVMNWETTSAQKTTNSLPLEEQTPSSLPLEEQTPSSLPLKGEGGMGTRLEGVEKSNHSASQTHSSSPSKLEGVPRRGGGVCQPSKLEGVPRRGGGVCQPSKFFKCEASFGRARGGAPEGRGRVSLQQGEGPEGHPLLLQSFHAVEQARQYVGVARSAFFPSVSLSAGVSSSYYRNLDAARTTGYGRQLKNNLGEYVALNFSIPIFSRLSNVTALRRAKNNLRIAEEQYAEKQTELDVLRRQAELDVTAYRKETEQAERKVTADSIAYQLVRQRYVAGLASPPDLQTSATSLLQARVAQLQARLMVGVKEMARRYYAGEQLLR